MDIDYSPNWIKIKKTGFFYQGERKVKYSEFKKLSDKQSWRVTMKSINSADEGANKRYERYLSLESMKNMQPGKFQSGGLKAELLDQETFLGLTKGPFTQKILEGVRTGAITKKTIRDALAKSFLETLAKEWELSSARDRVKKVKKRQFEEPASLLLE